MVGIVSGGHLALKNEEATTEVTASSQSSQYTSNGGEILNYVGDGTIQSDNTYLNQNVIGQFNAIPFVQIAICILLTLIMAKIVLGINGVDSVFIGKGISTEVGNVNRLKKRDAKILRTMKIINKAVKIVSRTPFTLDKSTKEYWDYNVSRAHIKVALGTHTLKAEELNALIVEFNIILCALWLVIGIVFNATVGFVLILASIIVGMNIPKIYIRGLVNSKDNEIKEQFTDFYLMIHYVLISDSKTPLDGIMKSYAKTTDSEEMKYFIDKCVYYIETYGEYDSTSYISKDYREITEVSKLMRLIRQANEGGNIKEELEGFRTELLNEKKYRGEERGEKLVEKAERSFYVLYIVLIQAILTAVCIYIPNLGVAKSIFGMA